MQRSALSFKNQISDEDKIKNTEQRLYKGEWRKKYSKLSLKKSEISNLPAHLLGNRHESVRENAQLNRV